MAAGNSHKWNHAAPLRGAAIVGVQGRAEVPAGLGGGELPNCVND